MPRSFLPLALVALLAAQPARADCELLYAPPQVRARLLAFHHANELRRARQPARHETAAAAPRATVPPRPGTVDASAGMRHTDAPRPGEG